MGGKAIIHIGLPKCASTSIQEVMASCGAVRYLGKRDNQYRSQELERLFRGEVAFSQEIDFNRERARLILAPHVEQSGHPVFLSDELFSGIGFKSYKRQVFLDPIVILDRLAALFDSVSFIVVIREQRRLLESYYAQMIDFGLNLSFRNWVKKELERPANLRTVLSYGTYIRFLQERYDDVHVVPFEALTQSAGAALGTVLGDLGVDLDVTLPQTNPRSDPGSLTRALVDNSRKIRGCGFYLNPAEFLDAARQLIGPGAAPPVEDELYHLDERTRRMLEKQFTDDNRQAADLIKQDLGGYGYLT